MENLRLGVSAVRHDMKREETVEEAEKNTELGRQTPKRKAARSNRAGDASAAGFGPRGGPGRLTGAAFFCAVFLDNLFYIL